MKEKREVYRFLRVTPRRIYHQRDQYVVGEKRAKEILALAACNHLKRIGYLELREEQVLLPVLPEGPERAGEEIIIERDDVINALEESHN